MAESRMAELARLEQAAHWNHRKWEPTVPPGSQREDIALSRIDELRYEELDRNDDTFEARRRRARRAWRRPV